MNGNVIFLTHCTLLVTTIFTVPASHVKLFFTNYEEDIEEYNTHFFTISEMMLRVFIILSLFCLAVLSLPLHKLQRRNVAHELNRDSQRWYIYRLAFSVISNYGGQDFLLNREELRLALNQILHPETTPDYLVPVFFRDFDEDGDELLSVDELAAAFEVYDPFTRR